MSFWSEHPVYTRHRRACACDVCCARRLIHAAAHCSGIHPDQLVSADRHAAVVGVRRVVMYMLVTGATGMEMPRSTAAVLMEHEPATVSTARARVSGDLEREQGQGGAVSRLIAAISAEYSRLVESDALAAGGW